MAGRVYLCGFVALVLASAHVSAHFVPLINPALGFLGRPLVAPFPLVPLGVPFNKPPRAKPLSRPFTMMDANPGMAGLAAFDPMTGMSLNTDLGGGIIVDTDPMFTGDIIGGGSLGMQGMGMQGMGMQGLGMAAATGDMNTVDFTGNVADPFSVGGGLTGSVVQTV